MDILPIQITEEGVLIPKIYLQEADEVEVFVTNTYVLVKPKAVIPRRSKKQVSEKPHRFSFIASGQTRNPARFWASLGAWEDDRPVEETLHDIHSARRSRTLPPAL